MAAATLLAVAVFLTGCWMLAGDDFGVALSIRNDGNSRVFVRTNSNAASPVLRVEPAAQGFGEFVEPGDFISVFDETCDLIAQITAPSESGPVLLIIAAGGDAVLSDEVITGKQRELPLAAECLGG